MFSSLLRITALAGTMILAASPAHTQGTAVTMPARDWKRTLRVQIDSAFAQSETSLTLQRVTRPGDVLVLQKDGMAAKPGLDGLSSTSKYMDGTIEQPSGLLAAISNNNQMQQFKAGQEVYTINTGVADDRVVFQLVAKELSTVTIEGNTRQVRLAGQLAVEFPRGYLATAPFADVMARISEVIRTQSAASAPRTVALGQRRSEVESILGRPTSVVDLGAKVMYVYPAMKIIFQDGKVADVQ
jgi:hypothetical protein